MDDNSWWIKLVENLEVLPLHHNEIYTEDCAKLINSEWKRSHDARMLSLQKSCDDLPTSLVMVRNKTEVVGHSKLSAIPSIPDACFVECVVIAKEHRGKGWGKYLMSETEYYAIRCGIQEIYLSAIHPVPGFYAKLGYVVCAPVSIYGRPSSPPAGASAPPSTSSCSPATVSPVGPSPPPPPMPTFKLYRSRKKVSKVYMKKVLYEVDL